MVQWGIQSGDPFGGLEQLLGDMDDVTPQNAPSWAIREQSEIKQIM
jgi:hypothetical protein